MKKVSGGGRQEYGYPEGDNQFALVDYKKLEDIVVWLEPAESGASIAGAAAADERPATVHFGAKRAEGQRLPIIAAGAGQRVEFVNKGGKPATVYAIEPERRFEIKDVKPGALAEHVFQSPGVVEILEAGRETPVATLVIAPTRFVRVARAGDDVEFKKVPPGAWRARAWHPRLPGASADAAIESGRRASATLTLTVNALPDAPQDALPP